MAESKDSLKTVMIGGLWSSNPVFALVLGMCPVLAVTSSLADGLGMGLAATFVLVLSNLFISALRKIIPDKMRIPCFIVVIASFVTIVDLCMKAYTPALSKSLGLFIPLIVVNCIILGRAEGFAYKKGLLPSLVDGFSMGVGFTIALMAMAFFREALGNGSLFQVPIFGKGYVPMLGMILPPGAFLTLGALMALTVFINKKMARK
ncbi:MAG: electron transport complex subunit E [Holophaga sp.]|nr:electron transport complex subunit E [Holophaga sp.]